MDVRSAAEPSRTTGAKRLELLATVLLALAAVATAWSSYPATRWNGEQAKAASQTNAIRIDAARAQGEAQAETEVDVALFIQPDAPPSPFALPEYQVESRDQADEYDRQAEVSAALVRRNIIRASNYVLAVVLFAVALFFAGISTKLVSERLRAVLLAVGWVVFLGSVTWIATFPISFVT